ncbi:hypothetical protein A5756_09300 [Mycobacterium sp. 852002-53434_SCH5985345]|uniref:hypothetical protein n=1 Tax=unclassified Mycobacterium TaxID=2642494 RepID=UPI0007FF5125|nr:MULTISPECIES: hypothetical protein [unclassified Mycobacterium]OBF57488.1 hypothetical protein A5756_09300 [Mycobacterium sp. 852002-53434_SCH5985345]OBF76261.1 hypothetical protein A5750_00070 [Mycobacterium sp. 852002-51613_SCH5001154]
MTAIREGVRARRQLTDMEKQLLPWWFATRTRSGAPMTICPWCQGPAEDHPLDTRVVPSDLVAELGSAPIEVRLCTGRPGSESYR